MSEDRKKSWREIDKQRDKSRHRRDERGRKPSKKNQRSSANYKKDLDALFASGGDVPERFQEMMGKLAPEEGSEEALWREAADALRETDGFREFAGAVSTFVREGKRLPDDEDLLHRMLDHPDERIVRAVLEHLLDLDERRGLDRPAPLSNRLRTIASISEDPRTLELVDRIKDIV